MFSILVLATSELHLPFGQSNFESSGLPYAAPFLPGKSTPLFAYSSCDLTRVLYAVSLTFGNFALMFLRKKPRDRFAVFTIRSMWGFHDRLLEMSTPRFLALVTVSRTCPWRIYSVLIAFLEAVTCTIWHFEGLNSIPHRVSHAASMSRSRWSAELSASFSIVR